MTNMRLGIVFVALVFGTQALAQTPTLTGTVFLDMNMDGNVSVGEGLGGVSVSLYQDDGDGIFDAATDTHAASGVTDASGAYVFAALGNANYFVHQGSQAVGTLQLADRVTAIANPTNVTLTIDDFKAHQMVEVNPSSRTAQSTVTAAGILGGQRDVKLEFITGSAESLLLVNPFNLSNVLQLNQDAGVNSVATITWSGTDPSVGLNGFDITAGGNNEAFSFMLGVDAAGTGDTLTMKIVSDSGMSSATIPITVTNGGATAKQIIPFSSFAGSASLTNVDAIQLLIGGRSPSIDMQLGALGVVGVTVQNIAHIPEPTSLLLAGLASVCGILSLRPRRRVA